jgi:hypothetical protein
MVYDNFLNVAVQASFHPQLATDAPHGRALATPCCAGMHIQHQSMSIMHTQCHPRVDAGTHEWATGANGGSIPQYEVVNRGFSYSAGMRYDETSLVF